MTHALERPTSPASFRRRSELDIAGQQLRAIERFHRVYRQAEAAATRTGRSREVRMDTDRRLEVLRRQHQAVVARVEEQLRRCGDVHERAGTVVLAHRSDWFAGKVSELLGGYGLRVVARVANGAEAIGAALAEQPDLLFVEETLAMTSGREVLTEVGPYCPQTVLAAQVADGTRVGALLEAGASAVFTRQIPPADVAARLQQMLVV